MVLLGLLLSTPVALAAYPSPTPVPRERGVVATDTLEASRAGAELLGRGGNAVDAAVAAALALGVVSPSGSGLGGGGFLVYWSEREQRAYVLDFRETAPRASTRDMFVVDGKAVAARSRVGGLSVAVPGEPAGLAEAERRFGKLGLAAAAAPAIRLAQKGFVALPRVAAVAARAEKDTPPDDLLMMRVLRPGGRPLAAGQRVDNPELARTLERLARDGSDGFYRGEVARAIVDEVARRGGLLTLDDLSEYRAVWRDPLQGHYRGRTLWTAPPPSGGATLIETLQVLEARTPKGLPAVGAGGSAADHLIIESLKHAFADRARLLGDPAFSDVPVARLTDPAYARKLAARIGEHASPPSSYGGDGPAVAPSAPRDHGTSHLCVADREGNVVALTTTINLPFGARFSAAGVVLNDEMDDFSAQPGAPNAFGLVGNEANAVAPGKRPLSSMSPVIVSDANGAVMCAGGSGGPLIVSETAQAIIHVLDFGMNAVAAVSAPRVHSQWVPDRVFVEHEVPVDVRENLEKRGHKVSPPPGEVSLSAAQVILLKPDRLEAASDPRKGGAPAAP
jgi:gamma-glutamyltranspeptidase / glutathione hydrolase